MNNTLLKNLFLSPEQSRDLAEFLAQERGNGNMSNDELSRALKASENKKKKRIDEIRQEIKELGHKLSRQELKEIKKNLYEIENKKGRLKSKKTKKYLNKLEKRTYGLNKYYDYDHVKYRGIRDIKDLFDLSISEDYYKLIIVNNAFNNNYIQYESKGDKILTIEEYLSMTKSYLVDMINDHKNKGKWKIQLCRKEFNKDDNDKKYHKVRNHCHYTGKYRGAAHGICNLRYKTSKEILVVFHNGSTYDYHFIIKNLAEEFEGEFECLGEFYFF